MPESSSTEQLNESLFDGQEQQRHVSGSRRDSHHVSETIEHPEELRDSPTEQRPPSPIHEEDIAMPNNFVDPFDDLLAAREESEDPGYMGGALHEDESSIESQPEAEAPQSPEQRPPSSIHEEDIAMPNNFVDLFDDLLAAREENEDPGYMGGVLHEDERSIESEPEAEAPQSPEQRPPSSIHEEDIAMPNNFVDLFDDLLAAREENEDPGYMGGVLDEDESSIESQPEAEAPQDPERRPPSSIHEEDIAMPNNFADLFNDLLAAREEGEDPGYMEGVLHEDERSIERQPEAEVVQSFAEELEFKDCLKLANRSRFRLPHKPLQDTDSTEVSELLLPLVEGIPLSSELIHGLLYALIPGPLLIIEAKSEDMHNEPSPNFEQVNNSVLIIERTGESSLLLVLVDKSMKTLFILESRTANLPVLGLPSSDWKTQYFDVGKHMFLSPPC
jgi:hypothetical protein